MQARLVATERLLTPREVAGVMFETYQGVGPDFAPVEYIQQLAAWCKANDAEKLDGSNGLLLSPHLDHLFARGYLSFSDPGDLLVSRYLNPAVLTSWGIALPHNVGAFRTEQCRYLEYHRREVFERHGGGRRQGADVDTVGARVGGEPVITQSE